jgi:hypothetical protein
MKQFLISATLVVAIISRPINIDLLNFDFAKQISVSSIINDVTFNAVADFKPNLDVPEAVKNMYDKAKLANAGLSIDVFNIAFKGFKKLKSEGFIQNEKLTICDFSKISGSKRMYVIDTETEKLVLQTLVAHGKNSGEAFATSFGNQSSSHKSSLGFYVTNETYQGANGFSLKLNGMDKGYNDNAYERAVVIHGADYVSEEAAETNGFIGRSFGCPAVARSVNAKLINEIKEGSCLFIYAPNEKFYSTSKWLN